MAATVQAVREREADGTRLKKDQAVIDVIDNGKRVWYVAAVAGVSQRTLRRWVVAERKSRASLAQRKVAREKFHRAFDETMGAAAAAPAVDAINPAHYRLGNTEVIDAIEDWQLGFHLGNSVKYIARAGKKDSTKPVEDLKKARWYLDRAILRASNGMT